MDKKAFAELVSSVRDMGRHMRGEKMAGARATKVREPNACARFSASPARCGCRSRGRISWWWFGSEGWFQDHSQKSEKTYDSKPRVQQLSATLKA